MPNFIVMGTSGDRQEWIDLLKAEWDPEKPRIHSYEEKFYSDTQKQALEEAEAVFLIVSSTDSTNSIKNDAKSLIQGAYGEKGLKPNTPLYLVIKNVFTQNDLDNQISKKIIPISGETSQKKPITLYQIKPEKKKTNAGGKASTSSEESSNLYFHDVFGYSSSTHTKFPASLKYTLTPEALHERRAVVNKPEKKARSSGSLNSSTNTPGKGNTAKDSPPPNHKDPTHGYTIVLKSSIEEFDRIPAKDELQLALDNNDLLHFNVIDLKNKPQQHSISKKDLTENLSPSTYNEFVKTFKEALEQKNTRLLNPFLRAIFTITSKAGYTRGSPDKKGSRGTGQSQKEKRITLNTSRVIQVVNSPENIDKNVPLNVFRMAVDDNDQSLHYALTDTDDNLQTGVISLTSLKARLNTRCDEFFTQFKKALKNQNPELVRPFLNDLLAIISPQRHKLIETPEDEGDVDSQIVKNPLKATNKGSKGSDEEIPLTTAGNAPNVNSTTQPEPSQKVPPKRWHKKWALSLGSLTLFTLALAGFILEVTLPGGFLTLTPTTVGWLAAVIAGTSLAPLTPVGVFVFAMFLAAFIIGGIAFCITNHEKIKYNFQKMWNSLWDSPKTNTVEDTEKNRFAKDNTAVKELELEAPGENAVSSSGIYYAEATVNPDGTTVEQSSSHQGKQQTNTCILS